MSMHEDDFLFGDDPERANDKSYTAADALAMLPLGRDRLIPPEVIYGFVDLSSAELELVSAAWLDIPADQRFLIMERLVDAAEADFALNYSDFAYVGYSDPAIAVRLAAIDMGWDDFRPRTQRVLMNMLQNDPAEEVRAAAAMQLGQFIYMSEVGEIEEKDAQEALILMENIVGREQETPLVWRRCLESICHSSSQDYTPFINLAYSSDDVKLQVSALTAMGNTCDSRWATIVLRELESEQEEIRYQAARASGTIGLERSIPRLREMVLNDQRLNQEIAIWALGEIGGDHAIAALTELYEHFEEIVADDDIIEAVDDALGMADLMLGFDDEDDEDFDDSAQEGAHRRRNVWSAWTAELSQLVERLEMDEETYAAYGILDDEDDDFEDEDDTFEDEDDLT